MVKRIVWTNTADKTFDSITAFLHDNASLRVAQDFAKLVYDKIDLISEYPTLGRKVPSTKSIRVLNIGKHHQLFYRVEGRTLVICNFFDTRQNPNKRPF